MRALFLVLLISVLGFFAYTHYLSKYFTGGSEGGMPQMGAMPVSVAEVVSREVTAWDEFSGRLEATDRVEIRARVDGTVDAIHFSEGQMVSKGDLLFTIDPKPYVAQLQSARAAADYAQAEFARAKTLFPEKAISQREYDEKRNAAEAATAQLTKAQLDLGYTQIKAPVSGRVSRAEITQGNLIAAGGQSPVLTTIVSLDPIYASFDVDEQSFVRYLQASGGNPEKLMQIPVMLALSGQQEFTYEGHVTAFDNELNVRSGTVRVRALFENPQGALIPGLFARVRVSGAGTSEQLLVNDRAIGTDQNKKIVFVLKPDNTVEYREVTLGTMDGGLRVIQQGLVAGEKIVVNGLQRAQPGAPVAPEMVDMLTLAGTSPAQPSAPAEAKEGK